MTPRPTRRALMGAALALPGAARAQGFPTRTVRLIVPLAPGGVVDTTARVLAPLLQERWGQSVVVENRSGASGTIGVAAARAAEPDGHTLLVAHSGEMAINPSLLPNLPYDPERDFVPIAAALQAPLAWVANAGAPFADLRAMLDAARARPGELAYASPGNGSFNHIMAEMFAAEAGISLTHVPYRGGGPAALAVAAGEVPLSLLAIPSALQHVQAGRMRVLGLAAEARSPLASEWPTLREGGQPFEALIWTGVFAPRALPAPIAAALSRSVLDVVADPRARDRFAAAGAVPMPLEPAPFARLVAEDARRFGAFIRARGIRAE